MCRSALVFYKKRNELRGFDLTCVTPDHMNIARAFIEGLTSSQCHFFSTADLHYDDPLQYIHKDVSVMAMYRLRTARRVYNRDHRAFLPWKLGKIPRHQRRYINLLCKQPTGS